MKPTLLVLALILAAGIAVWYGRSGSGSGSGPAPLPVAPSSVAQSPNAAGPNAQLEAESAARKAVPDPSAQPVSGRTAVAAAPAPPQMIEASTAGAGIDGGIPSDAASASGASDLEAKYAGVGKDDLKATYDSLRQLYDENNEGRVQDGARKLSAEGMAELEKEIAWLKEKAFGGG
jgi:hypothetical protein